MWRERLARQKAQAQATELRQQLSARQASTSAGSGSGSGGGGGGAASGAEDVDDALMQSLEAEMARADHLQDELKRHKASLGSREAGVWELVQPAKVSWLGHGCI